MVQYIKVGEGEYPFRLSWIATKLIKEEVKRRGGNMKDTESLENVEIFGYYGFVAGCRLEKKEFPYKLSDMELLFDADMSLVERITEAMENDKAPKEQSPNGKRGNPKK